MQTPLQLDIWLQSYEGFDNTKNNTKQRNWTLLLPISEEKNIPDIRLIPLDHVTFVYEFKLAKRLTKCDNFLDSETVTNLSRQEKHFCGICQEHQETFLYEFKNHLRYVTMFYEENIFNLITTVFRWQYWQDFCFSSRIRFCIYKYITLILSSENFQNHSRNINF